MAYPNVNSIEKTKIASEKANIEVNHVNENKINNNSRLIDTEHNPNIQFESIVIKMEQEDQFFEENEDIFTNPLLNQDDFKIGVSQNDIKLTSNSIKKEIQDSEEHLHEKFDKILDTYGTASNFVTVKEENEETNYLDTTLEQKQKNKSLSRKSKQQKTYNIVNVEDKNVKKYECTICKKTFLQSSFLTNHMRIHSGEKLHECSVCQKKFTWLSNVREHMQIHTGQKPYSCDICQRKFNNLSNRRKHMKTHTKEKNHQCNVCLKIFTHLATLIRHSIIHTERKPHECEVCHKQFPRSSNLGDHMKIHSGVRAHECVVCQKRFTHPHTLTMHMRIHTGEKPFQCEICLRKFVQGAHLRKHMKTHTGEKSHTCDICQKKFSESYNLRKHMNIHTRKQAAELILGNILPDIKSETVYENSD